MSSSQDLREELTEKIIVFGVFFALLLVIPGPILYLFAAPVAIGFLLVVVIAYSVVTPRGPMFR